MHTFKVGLSGIVSFFVLAIFFILKAGQHDQTTGPGVILYALGSYTFFATALMVCGSVMYWTHSRRR
jgi:hypothetical protein